MRCAILSLLALTACDGVPAPAIQVISQSDPAPIVSPGQSLVPAKTCTGLNAITSVSYADSPQEFCLNPLLDSGDRRIDYRGAYYQAAHDDCAASESRVCSQQELMGAARDGHLDGNVSAWIFVADYRSSAPRADLSASSINTTTLAVTFGHTMEINVFHHFYCCKDKE